MPAAVDPFQASVEGVMVVVAVQLPLAGATLSCTVSITLLLQCTAEGKTCRGGRGVSSSSRISGGPAGMLVVNHTVFCATSAVFAD
jgi:hypothetical protein